jgi:septal ring factor EnvC (AmiA/AmiB activator)
MKKIPAILASLCITACIGLGMFAVGANALFNPNGVAAASDPTSSISANRDSNARVPAVDANTTQLKQLQDLVAQYQQREQQYQQREQQYQDQLNQARQQLSQASQQVQQYQNVLEALQQAGIIQINGGQILIPRGFGDHD